MKTYRSLMESLPSKTIVLAFQRFNPPSTNHQMIVQFAKKLAKQNRADHAICASTAEDSKKNPLSAERKLHYLNILFPSTTFVGAASLIDAAKAASSKYKSLIVVAGSDCVEEYKKILDKHNQSEYSFDSIQVVSAGERDPDEDTAKIRSYATKGDFAGFRKCLPATMRDIDARRLMNDVRDGMGLEPIKEQIKFDVDSLRERYFRGEIFNVGDLVESLSGEQFEIVKRGTNHLLVKDNENNLHSKWIHEVFEGNKDA